MFLGDGPEALALADLLGIPAGCRYLFMAREGLKQVFEQLATQTVQARDAYRRARASGLPAVLHLRQDPAVRAPATDS